MSTENFRAQKTQTVMLVTIISLQVTIISLIHSVMYKYLH